MTKRTGVKKSWDRILNEWPDSITFRGRKYWFYERPRRLLDYSGFATLAGVREAAKRLIRRGYKIRLLKKPNTAVLPGRIKFLYAVYINPRPK